MDLSSRQELYEELTTISDWLRLGRRGKRPVPVFQEAEGRTQGGGSDADDTLDRIGAEVNRCVGCRLAAGRKNTVLGEGVPRPEVLVVGEAPGEEEDEHGRAFIGPAGRLLDKMLAAVNLDRGRNCYIANIVKCRPPMNRDPAPDERAACAPYLDRQIRILKPRVILALGRTAAQSLLETQEGITRLRGEFFDYRGIPLLATYHPSALLRDESLKRPAWEDLKKLRAFLDNGPPS